MTFDVRVFMEYSGWASWLTLVIIGLVQLSLMIHRVMQSDDLDNRELESKLFEVKTNLRRSRKS
jgi:hypothetical protein